MEERRKPGTQRGRADPEPGRAEVASQSRAVEVGLGGGRTLQLWAGAGAPRVQGSGERLEG